MKKLSKAPLTSCKTALPWACSLTETLSPYMKSSLKKEPFRKGDSFYSNYFRIAIPQALFLPEKKTTFLPYLCLLSFDIAVIYSNIIPLAREIFLKCFCKNNASVVTACTADSNYYLTFTLTYVQRV